MVPSLPIYGIGERSGSLRIQLFTLEFWNDLILSLINVSMNFSATSRRIHNRYQANWKQKVNQIEREQILDPKLQKYKHQFYEGDVNEIAEGKKNMELEKQLQNAVASHVRESISYVCCANLY